MLIYPLACPIVLGIYKSGHAPLIIGRKMQYWERV